MDPEQLRNTMTSAGVAFAAVMTAISAIVDVVETWPEEEELEIELDGEKD